MTRLASPGLLQKMVGRWPEPLPQSSFFLAPARCWVSGVWTRVTSSRHCLPDGEEKSNRDNPTFKNRRNLMNPNEITFSNRDKNTTGKYPLASSMA
jgi:hypothetical protein